MKVCLLGLVATSLLALQEATVLMRIPVDGEPAPTELIATRATTHHTRYWRPPSHERDVERRYLDDTVDVYLLDSAGERTQVWSRTKRVGRDFDISYSMQRLVLYDAFYTKGDVWVLYSEDSQVFVDRVVRREVGSYHTEETVEIVKLTATSFRPYVIETGIVFHHDDALTVGAYLRSYRAHDREHPYVFWQLKDRTATEIKDQNIIRVLLESIGDQLEKDRPRLSEQMKAPWEE